MTSGSTSASPTEPAPPPPERIAEAAGLAGMATLTSRILGLVREQVLAALFGASDTMDAFYVAFRIPNLLQNLFGLEEPVFNIYSMWGMIWVDGLHYSPVAFLLMTAAFRAMDPSLEESAMMSGANVLQVVWHVTLKLAWPAIFATFLMLFVRAIESFEVPALLGLPAARKASWEKFLAQREPEKREASPTVANYEKRPQPLTFQHPFSVKGSMERTQVPADCRLQLFAAEPDIAKPIFMAWDERGRLWVAETRDYPHDVKPDGPVALVCHSNVCLFERSTDICHNVFLMEGLP